ncbi:MAG TPA: catalase [Plasticicumulans sp.]|uniref:catalase n=1 Tax=Plasticicumulans sp. TaxID=2307179 RepID=UPI002D1405AA|nr:catalase [Plasticicumulans sp.]HNG48863.1 catalase [Plasticicumulans sp.]
MSHENAKQQDLARATTDGRAPMSTNQGQPVGDDQNSLKAGGRGPTLLEDFLLREKLQHFDHERIPERVVHARGAAAHGFFEVYDDSLSEFTTAQVLTDPSLKTPVFVRFSTVAGSRGSADTARDVRGFAVKMYTPQGNWDLVGNNIPVFFIQDAIKFPDLIHAAKAEPHNEIPQAATAHDTFWDFISLTPEAMHMIMWVMSDRAIPRSYALMDGFGVHTFRLVNAEGVAHFVKYHWKPKHGAHSLVWDEALKLAGADPDFHRKDLWESIEAGNCPEWELAVQIFDEATAAQFDFDILDATKIVPEDLVPLRRVGRMVLDRNPDNFFAETEQVAFMTTNIVPGMDFTEDPLLQGRNFSYLDTQLSRLGSPNFSELPINRPLACVANHQRDAHMRHTINKGRVAYAPASLDGHDPAATGAADGFHSHAVALEGRKLRERSPSFADHYGQAKLFWNSQTAVERAHIAKALSFELSKVATREVRVRMLDHLQQINPVLAAQVGRALGETAGDSAAAVPPSAASDKADEIAIFASAVSPTSASGRLQSTRGLSLLDGSQPASAAGRKVAVLAAPGSDASQILSLRSALSCAGAQAMVVGPHLGPLTGEIAAMATFANSSSVLFDAVFVPGGAPGVQQLTEIGEARRFLDEAYRHGKPIGVLAEGRALLAATQLGTLSGLTATAASGSSGSPAATLEAQGVLIADGSDVATAVDRFVATLARHRFPDRPLAAQIAA